MGAFKTGAMVGFGIGYMQGAKAGRQRYEQIQQKIKKVSESPTVKKAIEPVKPIVNAKLESGKELMGSVMSKAGGAKSGSGGSGGNSGGGTRSGGSSPSGGAASPSGSIPTA